MGKGLALRVLLKSKNIDSAKRKKKSVPTSAVLELYQVGGGGDRDYRHRYPWQHECVLMVPAESGLEWAGIEDKSDSRQTETWSK